MKLLLTLMCGLVVLFAGGCGLILVGGAGIGGLIQSGGFSLLPLAVALLNALVIGALWGWLKVQRWAFLTLAIMDAIVVAITLIFWLSVGFADRDANVLIGIPTLIVAIKGLMTYTYWRSL